MRGTFRAMIAADLRERMPRMRASTLLVWGDQDDDTPLWMGQRMEELIPDSGLVVLEGAGHYSYADSPGQFRAVARQFLVRAAARGRETVSRPSASSLAGLGLLVLIAGRLHFMLHLFQLEHYEAARLRVWVQRREALGSIERCSSGCLVAGWCSPRRPPPACSCWRSR